MDVRETPNKLTPAVTSKSPEDLIQSVLNGDAFPDPRAQMVALDKAFANKEVRKLLKKDAQLRENVSAKYRSLIRKFAYQLYLVSQELFKKVPLADYENTDDDVASISNLRKHIYKISAIFYEDFFSATSLQEKLIINERWIAILQCCFELGNFLVAGQIFDALSRTLISRLNLTPYISETARSILKCLVFKEKPVLYNPQQLIFLMANRHDLLIPQLGPYKTVFVFVKDNKRAIQNFMNEKIGLLHDKWIIQLYEIKQSEHKIIYQLYRDINAADEALKKNRAMRSEIEATIRKARNLKIEFKSLEMEISGLDEDYHSLLKQKENFRRTFQNNIPEIFANIPEPYKEFLTDVNNVISEFNQQLTTNETIRLNVINELQNLKARLNPICAEFNPFQKYIAEGMSPEELEELESKYEKVSKECVSQDKSELQDVFNGTLGNIIIRKFSPSLEKLNEVLTLYAFKNNQFAKLLDFKLNLTRHDKDLISFVAEIITKLESRISFLEMNILLEIKIKQAAEYKNPKLIRILKELRETCVSLEKLFIVVSAPGKQPEVKKPDTEITATPRESFFPTLRKKRSSLFGRSDPKLEHASPRSNSVADVNVRSEPDVRKIAASVSEEQPGQPKESDSKIGMTLSGSQTHVPLLFSPGSRGKLLGNTAQEETPTPSSPPKSPGSSSDRKSLG